MKTDENKMDVIAGTANKRLAFYCLLFSGGMLGLSFAAVPLYQIFCQVTGYAGTTQRVEQVADRVLERTINVRFDANVSNQLGWDFTPKQREITLKLGESITVSYLAKNIGLESSTGTASFNVTPENAGAYFNKLECFCFTETTLQVGESLDMPVTFFIDPDVAKNADMDVLKTITLSYTFFPNGSDAVAEAAF